MNAIKLTWVHLMIALGVIIVAVLLRVFIGVSVWLTLGLVVLFGICTWLKDQSKPDPAKPETATESNRGLRKFASIIQIVTVVVFVGSGIMAFLPRFNEGRKVAIANSDRFFARLMGTKTTSLANDIWDAQERKAGKVFLLYYNHLLELGQTQEAADTLAGFNKHWSSDLLKDNKPNKIGQASDSNGSKQIPADDGSYSSGVAENGFYYESKMLRQNEAWMSKHSFNQNDSVMYKVEGTSAFIQDSDATEHLILADRLYGGVMVQAGPASFLAKNGPVKVTVYYKI